MLDLLQGLDASMKRKIAKSLRAGGGRARYGTATTWHGGGAARLQTPLQRRRVRGGGRASLACLRPPPHCRLRALPTVAPLRPLPHRRLHAPSSHSARLLCRPRPIPPAFSACRRLTGFAPPLRSASPSPHSARRRARGRPLRSPPCSRRRHPSLRPCCHRLIAGRPSDLHAPATSSAPPAVQSPI